MAVLAESIGAIEQNNGGKRMTRSDLVTFFGQMVNDKLEKEGKEIIDTIQFFDRIQQINAPKQRAHVADPIEARRVRWLTYQNLKAHYIKWEETLIKLGFGRKPNSAKERHEKGFVVFYPGQQKRIIFFDEVKISLDGSSDENAGGRPSVTLTSSRLNDPGKVRSKSGENATLMIGTIDLEPIPPLIIYPTSVGDKKNYKVSAKCLRSFPQIAAKYLYPRLCYHDPMFAMSPKGGMNGELFNCWFNEYVLPCIPDIADSPGKRVMATADMGPGRKGIEFLSRAKVDGVYFFPKVPNTTNVTQEMDQQFGPFKASVYTNRDKLWLERQVAGGQDLSREDFGHIIFGGHVEVSGTNSIYLNKAFVESFTEKKIEDANRKCGYNPATRAALYNSKVRHELVDTDEDCSEEDAYDAAEKEIGMFKLLYLFLYIQNSPPPPPPFIIIALLLQSYEDSNHEVVDKLISKGYVLAEEGRRFVKRVSKEQSIGREAARTLPGTLEHQDYLVKLRYAGDFHFATGGGGVLNSSDLFLGHERKIMNEKAELLEKVKAFLSEVSENEKAYFELVDSDRDWKKSDYIVAIRRHHGIKMPPEDERAIATMKVGPLSELYNSKYIDKELPSIIDWSIDMECELNRLKKGELNSFQETSIYGKALEKNENYLFQRLQSVSKDTKLRVLAQLGETLDDDEKKLYCDCICDSCEVPTLPSYELTDIVSEELLEIAKTWKAKKRGRKVQEEIEDTVDDDNVEVLSDGAASVTSSIIPSPVFKHRPRRECTASSKNYVESDSSLGEDSKSASFNLDDSEDELNTSINIGEKMECAIKNIQDLNTSTEKEESAKQATFEAELEKCKTDLLAAQSRLKSNGHLTMKHLSALIRSKGYDPPEVKRGGLPALQKRWEDVKNEPNWVRTEYFTEDE